MMYDEDEDFGDHRSAMIRFVNNLALGIPIEVHKGSARGWLHASDAVRAISAAVHVKDFSIINIGSPDVRSISELAEIIRKNLNADPGLVKVCEIPQQMTLIKKPSLDRMRNLLGIEPLISLEEGVKRVCKKVKERLRLEGLIQ
jgi:nucleoside-diphosphate-sugar epimerase